MSGKKRGKLNPRELRFGARRKAQEGPATANADEPKGRRAEGPKEAPRTVIGQLAVRRKTVFDWQESREPVSPGSGTAREAAPGSRGGGEASARRGRAFPAFRRRGGPPGKRRCVAAGRLCIPGLHARPGWRARFGMAWWEGPSGGRGLWAGPVWLRVAAELAELVDLCSLGHAVGRDPAGRARTIQAMGLWQRGVSESHPSS